MKLLFLLLFSAFLSFNAFALDQKVINGINADVDTGTEDVWPSGATYAYPSSAAATKVLSSSANDTSAGTGARTVRVKGLNASLYEIVEDATMNGTADVVLVNQFYRVNSVEVLTAGSGATNAGSITVQQSTTVLCSAPTGAGRSQTTIFTTSKNQINWGIRRLYGAATNAVAGAVSFSLMTRSNGGAWHTRYVFSVYGTSKSSENIVQMMPIPLGQGMDIRIVATSTADNTAVSAGFDIVGQSTPMQ